MSQSRIVARAVVLAAIAVALSPLSFPLVGARVYPAQHMVNVMAAVIVGPWWGAFAAGVAAVARNAAGTGTFMAFPGGMIGVFLAGWAYRLTGRVSGAVVGEVVGTGLIGSLIAAAIVAPLLMDRPMHLAALVVPFTASATVGAGLGVVALRLLTRAGLWDPRDPNSAPTPPPPSG